MGELIIFGGLAALITLCSVLVVTLSNPVSAAIFLVMDLFLLAAVYAFQGADFVAAIQIIIYTGAILVLFLFVIMILNLKPQVLVKDQKWRIQELGILFLSFCAFVYLISKLFGSDSSGELSSYALADNTGDLALLLFQDYVWPFEIISFLILLSIVGAISIAHKKKKLEGGVKSAD